MSMGNSMIGVQTRLLEEKKYRWYQNPEGAHLPIIYGTRWDYDLFFRSKTLILTEGIFDKIAVKRCLPDTACFARLSKGASGQLTIFLKRYCENLYLAFDTDKAGEKGYDTIKKSLGEHLNTFIRLEYPGKDPSDYLERVGESSMRKKFQDQIAAQEF